MPSAPTSPALPPTPLQESQIDTFEVVPNTTGLKCTTKHLYSTHVPYVPNAYPRSVGTSYGWGSTFPSDDEDGNDSEAEGSIRRAGRAAEQLEHALLLRTSLRENKHRLHSIVVQSPLIKEALKGVLAGYPGLHLAKETLVLHAPFKPFVHRWQRFVELCEKCEDGQAREHLMLLKKTLIPEVRESLAAIRAFEKHGLIDFDHFWAVLEPGKVVVQPEGKALRAYSIRHAELEYDMNERRNYLRLKCSYVDWDGKKFGRSLHDVDIRSWKGANERSELPVVPLDYHPEKESIKQDLIQRGKLFHSFAGVHYKAYDGTAYNEFSEPVKRNATGRIVVDAALYYEFTGCRCKVSKPLRADVVDFEEKPKQPNQPERWARERSSSPNYRVGRRLDRVPRPLSDDQTKEIVELTDEELMLCRHLVRGYSLKSKKWLEFDVTKIKDIRWHDKAFDSLALAGEYKHLLLAFTKSQSSNADQFDDVIEGKGKGMVMLLEGPPGVGKTLTVESVAEEMKVPLYCISAGDLGIEAGGVQDRLEDAFEIASSWNAVILLDEADIFLEKRSINDLQRNQLVSIFLQSLEYYTGTIFLTTNRISCIDPAFNSRIHMSLPYPALSASSRLKVWRNFLTTLQGVDVSEVLEEEEQEDSFLHFLADHDLNGRQIKNIVKMAGLLATSEGGELKRAHLSNVIDIVSMKESEAAYAEEELFGRA